MPVVVRTIGTVLANSVVNIKSQIDGPLLEATFKEGQMVKKGDLLFQIDPAPFEATVRQSEAQMARDQAQLESAKADADRAVMLAERGIVSAQQRDQLVANAKALAATVEADKAALDRAKLNLGYTTDLFADRRKDQRLYRLSGQSGARQRSGRSHHHHGDPAGQDHLQSAAGQSAALAGSHARECAHRLGDGAQ